MAAGYIFFGGGGENGRQTQIRTKVRRKGIVCKRRKSVAKAMDGQAYGADEGKWKKYVSEHVFIKQVLAYPDTRLLQQGIKKYHDIAGW